MILHAKKVSQAALRLLAGQTAAFTYLGAFIETQ
jgi:hypothetical protein